MRWQSHCKLTRKVEVPGFEPVKTIGLTISTFLLVELGLIGPTITFYMYCVYISLIKFQYYIYIIILIEPTDITHFDLFKN